MDPKLFEEATRINGRGVEGGSTWDGSELIADRYRVVGLVGMGGMGAVYRVHDTELDEMVALKVLKNNVVDTPGMLERFRREVKLARRVTHKNVARTFDIGDHGNQKFLTMELIEGEALTRLVAKHRAGMPLDARFFHIVLSILEGLEAAHQAGVVHRDLKPDNVLVAANDRIVITDFGIARAAMEHDAAHTAGFIGTPTYMAPEQLQRGAVIDARTDLYAFGVMLYQLVTGELPWKGDSIMEILTDRLSSPPPDPRKKRPQLAPGLSAVISRCMARNPDERFASAREVAAALATLESSASDTMPIAIDTPPAVTRPESTPFARTVAILPFQNLGPADDAYLAEGLTEELIDLLSMVKGLRVRPRGMVMNLKGSIDPRSVGRELDVEVIVEGSIRKLGDRARVQTRVLGVADGFQLWAKRFECAAGDLLNVGDEIAKAIAEALAVELRTPPTSHAIEAQAADLYLRARFELQSHDAPRVALAVDLFRQAAELAPSNPRILSGAAIAWARLWYYGAEGAAEGAFEAARRALEAAPDRPEVFVALAAVKLNANDAKGAVGELRKALVRSPGFSDAHALLGTILSETGPLLEAMHHLKTALTIDPNSEGTCMSIARTHALEGNWDEAERVLDKERSAGPAQRPWVARVRIAGWRRDFAKIASFLQAPEIASGDQPLVQGALEMLTGKKPMGSAVSIFGPKMPSSNSSARGRAFVAQIQAEMALAFGSTEPALDAIESAVDLGLFDIVWMDRCPLLDAIKEHPRWPKLRAQVAERAEEAIAAFRAKA
jgi:eukaryotic-like serine/threonine-protein kinase